MYCSSINSWSSTLRHFNCRVSLGGCSRGISREAISSMVSEIFKKSSDEHIGHEVQTNLTKLMVLHDFLRLMVTNQIELVVEYC